MIVPATDQEAIPLALAQLRAENVVAVPTETVYGLAGDATSVTAVRAIYHIKARPPTNPLIAHVSDMDMARHFVDIDALSQSLIDAFWPGPLTLVLPLKAGTRIPALASAGLPTLALRQPQGIFSQIIAKLGRPLVAPSANRSGRISPTDAQAVAAELGKDVPLILDGGSCRIGLESTILKVQGADVFMLRAGAIPRAQIEQILHVSLQIPRPNHPLVAPGMLSSHYAPQAKVRLNVQNVHAHENLLAFGHKRAHGHQQANRMLNLSPSGNLAEAARHLFDYLRQLDEGEIIAVEPIPETGLGEAINDRLRRAAAPRPATSQEEQEKQDENHKAVH